MLRKQDIGALFFNLVGYSKIRDGFLRLGKRPATRIINFHDIDDQTYGQFREKMIMLRQEANVVSLDDYLAGRLTFKRINIVITFDDGYKGWIKHAIPVLKEMKLPATFFVTSGFVGLTRESESEFIHHNLFRAPMPRKVSGGLTYDDVRLIVKEGFSIGSHTRSHCDLRRITEAGKVEHEIVGDKQTLERISGIRIEYFAYPMGGYDNPRLNLPEYLRELGFRAAVTTVPGFNFRGSDPYLLHRDLTDVSMPACVFRARIAGNYDAVNLIKRLFVGVARDNESSRPA